MATPSKTTPDAPGGTQSPGASLLDSDPRLAALADAFPADVLDLEQLAGKPELLDVIGDQGTMDHERSAYSFKVYQVGAGGGRGALLPHDWHYAVPTESRLAEMVREREIAPGRYRVVVRKGRTNSRPIEMTIAPPLGAVGGGPEGDPLGMMERVARLLMPPGGPVRDVAALPREVVETLHDNRREAGETVDRLESLEDTVGQLSLAIAQGMAALQENAGAEGTGNLIQQLVAAFTQNGEHTHDTDSGASADTVVDAVNLR